MPFGIAHIHDPPIDAPLPLGAPRHGFADGRRFKRFLSIVDLSLNTALFAGGIQTIIRFEYFY